MSESASELEILRARLDTEIALRKDSEEKFHQSEERYSTVIQYLREIIFQTDAQGNWIFLNKAWSDVMGYSLEESMGTLFLNYVHPDDRQRNAELFQPLIERKKEYCNHMIRYVTKDNSIRWIDVYARLGLDENDQITGTYGTLRDVTESRMLSALENELLQLSVQVAATPLDRIEDSITLSLAKMGTFLNADRSYIFEFDLFREQMSNTYEWCADGIVPQIQNLKEIKLESGHDWSMMLKDPREIIIPSVVDLPDTWSNAKERLLKRGVKSMLAIPLFFDNVVNGIVCLDIVRSKKTFTSSEVNILKMWGNMLSNLLQKKRNEELLNQALKNFENFFNANVDMLFVFDEHGVIIQVNDMVCKTIGYKRDEILGKEITLLTGTVHPEKAMSDLWEILEGKKIFSSIFIQAKDGHRIPVETTYKYGFWNNKQVIFGVSRDMTEIRLSEEKFTRAFQSDSVLMFMFSLKSMCFVDVNDAFLKLLGLQRSEFIGKKFVEVPMFRSLHFSGMTVDQLQENLPLKEEEFEITRKDGKTLTILLSADLIYMGPELSVIATMVDITERKRTELDLEESRAEAEKANRAKSEFLSRMSHELRTPMNSILGFAQLLEMGDLSENQKKGVNHILNSGKHLLNLINEVLDISRIEAGKLVLKPEKLRIIDLIHECVDLVTPLLDEKQVSLELDLFAVEYIHVVADKQRLMQVLINLISNAIKYNKDQGKVTVVGQLESVNIFGKPSLRITITDTGIGVSKEDLPRLFNPFERLSTYQLNVEGTGLGLPIARDLIHAMGGRIGVESAKGVGSSFWIEVNVYEENETENMIAPYHEINLKKSNMTKGKILYIEDNNTNTELVRQLLINFRPDVELIAAMTGQNAVPLALEHKPALLLLDMNLPDMHGSEVYDNFKANDQLKNMPVVVISADVMPDQIEKMMNAGVKEYLTKPLDVQRLLNLVDSYLIN